jgi:DNA-binding beta-propeller fold protein YncE
VTVGPRADAGSVVTSARTRFLQATSIVVDAQNGRVFVSGGDGSEVIQAWDLEGRVVGEVQGQYDVADMALVDGLLYAFRPPLGRISVIDPATLELQRVIQLGPADALSLLAPAGGRLWVGSGACSESGGDVVGVDPANDHTIVIPHASPFCSVAVSPGPDSGTLVTFNPVPEGNSSTITRWDVTGPEAHARVSRRLGYVPSDVSFSNDGKLMYVSGLRSVAQVYSTSDFTHLWDLEVPFLGYTQGVVTAPDGATVALGLDTFVNESPDDDVAVFPAGASKSFDGVNLEGSISNPTTVFARALAFSPSGELFVGGRRYDNPDGPEDPDFVAYLYRTSVATTAPDRRTQLSLAVGRVGGGRYDVHCDSDGTLAGRRVSLYRTTWEGATLERTMKLDADGRCYTTVDMRKTGSLYATFAGDDDLVPTASAPFSIFIRPTVIAQLLGGFRKHRRYVRFADGVRPIVRGSVQPIQRTDGVGFRVQGRVHGRWVAGDVEKFHLNRRGEIFVALKNGKARVPYRARTEYRWHNRSIRSAWKYFEIGPFHHTRERGPRRLGTLRASD